MAHRVNVSGTTYEVKGGKCKVSGTAYDVKKGRTKVGGTAYDISFSSPITITLNIPKTQGRKFYYSLRQSIEFQIDSRITTYAELADASDYNTVTIPDSEGNTLTVCVSGGYPGGCIERTDGTKMTFAKEDIGDPTEIMLTDGVVVDFSGSITLPSFDYSKWDLTM